MKLITASVQSFKLVRLKLVPDHVIAYRPTSRNNVSSFIRFRGTEADRALLVELVKTHMRAAGTK